LGERARAPKRLIAETSAPKWANLILGRSFRDAVLPDFLDFLLVQTIT
jgi:hypothetical protein